MCRSVDELIDSISHDELLEWAEFYRHNPWPDTKADAYMANICATLANINRDEKKRKESFTANDFLLTFKSATPQEDLTDDDWYAGDDDEDFGAAISPMTVAFFFQKAKVPPSVH